MKVSRKLFEILLLCNFLSHSLTQNNYFDEYSEDDELTPEKFLGLERDKHREEGQSHDTKTIKDNKKRDYHEMIDSLIKDWYDPAKYLNDGGYLSPESDDKEDVGKEFLTLDDSNPETNSDNSTSVFDKIKKTLKKVFKPSSGYSEESSLYDGDDLTNIVDPGVETQIDGINFVNTTNLTTTTPQTPIIPSLNLTNVENVTKNVSIEKYPKILRGFSEEDMEFLKNLLSCLRKSVNVTVRNRTVPILTTVAPIVTTQTTKKVKNDSVSHVPAPTNITRVDIKKEHLNATNVTDSQKLLNQTNFVLKCVPMQNSSDIITFNCTKEPCFDVTYFSNASSSNKNASQPSNNSTKQTLIENKLKYLAHLHHPTNMVGKVPQKPVDLANVQKIIDEAKYGMFPGNEEVEVGNDTIEHANDPSKVSKRSRLTRDYYSDDEGSNYEEKLDAIDYISDDYDELRERKSKKSKKRIKGRHKNRNNAETHDNPPQKDTKVSPELSDFSEIQLKLTPEQEMEIHKFEADLNSPPEPFHFDIDKFIKEKSYEKPVEVSQTEITTKKYFEFERSYNKRDLNTKLEAYRNLVRGNKETYAPVMYNYNDAYAKTYRKELLSELKDDPKDDNLIDNYYLLNDGTAQETHESLPTFKHREQTPNLLDLDIDLRLNKEFQDLEYEKEKVLSGEGDIKDSPDQKSYRTNTDQMYHFNAIR